jgi:LysM repeat protein
MFGRLSVLLVILALAVALAARPSGGAGGPTTYVVKPADTLWSIAAAHYAGDPRENVWKLERRNHLRDATLVAGQRLLLP